MKDYKEPWEMLADKKIWSILSDPDFELSNDYMRLMFIDLFSRVKKLETDNYALKVLLLETGIVEEETYKVVTEAVREYLHQHDKYKEQEVDFYSKSGISFVDWVNFMANGKFQPAPFEQ